MRHLHAVTELEGQSSRHAITFTVDNAERLILSGEKTQTLRRAKQHRAILPNNILGLFAWSGRPRQKGSRLKEIAEIRCEEVAGPFSFHLHHEPCPVYTRRRPSLCFQELSPSEKEDLARRDGFEMFEDLVEALRGFYGREAVQLVAIRWKQPEPEGD